MEEVFSQFIQEKNDCLSLNIMFLNGAFSRARTLITRVGWYFESASTNSIRTSKRLLLSLSLSLSLSRSHTHTHTVIYIYIHIYICYNIMETQTQLSRHNKFISAENIITILSVRWLFTCFSLVINPYGLLNAKVILVEEQLWWYLSDLS